MPTPASVSTSHVAGIRDEVDAHPLGEARRADVTERQEQAPFTDTDDA